MKDNLFVQVLDRAKEKNIAVGAVNIFNYLSAEAAVLAAKEAGVDLIIQTSAGTVKDLGAKNLYDMIDSLRKVNGVNVALHLDHCRDKELGRLCADTGWDSIMMDFSKLPFDENVAATRELAEYAHARGVAIEGEIGVISGVEEDIVAGEKESTYANYEETMRFIELSQIDAIAPAIGTAHGVYKGVPKLNYDLVEQLGKGNTPIVIHGGTGLTAEQFRKLIVLGGRKVNISTLVKNAYLGKIRELIETGNKLAPIGFDQIVRDHVKEEIKKHLLVFSGQSMDFGESEEALANYECDLHGHTNRSDGNDTPAEFIDQAVRRGLKIVAITDHDVIPPATVVTQNGVEDIMEYAGARGIKLLRGIEISCETDIDDTHLVCFGCDWNRPFFRELDAFTKKSKVDSYRRLVEALDGSGMQMTWDEVLDNDGNPISEHNIQKKMIFELMARKGYVKTWSDGKILVKNNRDYVIKREKPDAEVVIKKIHEMGGVVILAHPYLISEPVNYHGNQISRKEFIDILIEAGLDGIEASYTYDKTSYGGTLTKDQIYAEVIEEYKDRGLIISGGSDYHADAKKGIENPRNIGECGISLAEFYEHPILASLI